MLFEWQIAFISRQNDLHFGTQLIRTLNAIDALFGKVGALLLRQTK
jgi:hypothetical protein